MDFGYQYYKNFLLFGALLLFVIGLVFLVFIIRLLRNEKPNLISKKTIFSFKVLIMTAISVFLITISFLNLRYGIHLIYENDSDSMELIGVIDEIHKTWFIQGYYNEGGKVDCMIVVIDQERFLFVTIGNLVIGDEIKIEYLPKSRVVLSYEKVIE